MYYQFRVDGRPAAPIRETWEDAVMDAAVAGYATITGPDEARLDEQAEIARLSPNSFLVGGPI